MNTKKPSLGAGRQMSRQANPVSAPVLNTPSTSKPKTSEKKSTPVEASPAITAKTEIPSWSHQRGVYVNRKGITTTETLRGVTHSGYAFETLEVGQPVYLMADPFGQFVKPGTGHDDPTAVSVQDNFVNGKHIGYLSKTVAATITKYLTKGYGYEAEIYTIKGGYEGMSGEMLNYGVDILIKFYPPQEG